MARMIVADHDYVTKRYNLHKLKELEELVAEAVQVRHSDWAISLEFLAEIHRSICRSTILLLVSV